MLLQKYLLNAVSSMKKSSYAKFDFSRILLLEALTSGSHQ
ncbi:hypothetical protein SynPROS91_01506 [Synechococcus sp. PROS-9-1]|nr:hypothetical protein SynPROS91_01506 [Synechococcus sp. PROS-9-1]